MRKILKFLTQKIFNFDRTYIRSTNRPSFTYRKTITSPQKNNIRTIDWRYTSDNKDHRCKWIKDGKEQYGVITRTIYQHLSNNTIKTHYEVLADYTFDRLDDDLSRNRQRLEETDVVLLSRNPGELIRLKIENQELRRRCTAQKKELAIQNRSIESHSKQVWNALKDLREYKQQVKNTHLTKQELIDFINQAADSPTLMMTSEDPKTREFGTIIAKQLFKDK